MTKHQVTTHGGSKRYMALVINQSYISETEETSRPGGDLDSSLKLTLYALVRLP